MMVFLGQERPYRFGNSQWPTYLVDCITAAALYTFAAHYHSGQFSRGYRLLCAAERAWRRRTCIGPRLGYWEHLVKNDPTHPVTEVYSYLREHYAGKV